MIFIEPDTLLYLVDKELNLVITPGSDANNPKVKTSSGEPDAEQFDKIPQDGIEIFISKKLNPESLFQENQINITMKRGLLGRSWSATITPKQKATGFMGMRC